MICLKSLLIRLTAEKKTCPALSRIHLALWKTLAIKFILLSKTISGQQYFGIQYWGECWGGEDADETYNMYGSDPLGCYDNVVGMEWHNMVYKFESKYKKTLRIERH